MKEIRPVKNFCKKSFSSIRCEIYIFLLLATMTFTAYWQVRHHDFVNYDDTLYVTENPHVTAGFTVDGVKMAFTDIRTGNWHPVTLLSHMLDCQLFGLNPGPHHLSNLFFHIINALLLFHILYRTTGDLWPSSFVSALFALHPLHVESVAWVSERKDVLSTFFLLLTIWNYIIFIKHKMNSRYLAIHFFFILGLMAKPMLVTLPFLLLLLDFWPLRRLGKFDLFNNNRISTSAIRPVYDLIREKYLLFFISSVFCIITYITQKSAGAVGSIEKFPFDLRLGNALVSYTNYIVKMVWPSGMAVFYPHPEIIPVWESSLSFIVLVLLTVLSLRFARNYPYFIVGWLWYLFTLLPVIGLIKVGLQAMADRYTYIPLVGLFIIFSWGMYDLMSAKRIKVIGFWIISIIVLSIFSILSWKQIKYWENTETLYQQALDVTDNNYFIHVALGNELDKQGKLTEANSHYREAIRIKPNFATAHNQIAQFLAKQEKYDEAMYHFKEAIRIKPDFAEAYYYLGYIFEQQGRLNSAILQYKTALRINPNYGKAHNSLGTLFYKLENLEKSVLHYQKAVNILPYNADWHFNLGITLLALGKKNAAVNHFLTVLDINSADYIAHFEIGNVMFSLRNFVKANYHYSEALKIKPDHAETHNNMGAVLVKTGKTGEAIAHFKEALRINPEYTGAYNNLQNSLIVLEKQKELSQESINSE